MSPLYPGCEQTGQDTQHQNQSTKSRPRSCAMRNSNKMLKCFGHVKTRQTTRYPKMAIEGDVKGQTQRSHI